jgi:DNA-directed RNA polymerase beta' subunit
MHALLSILLSILLLLYTIQIINVAKSPRTPGLAIYLSSDCEQDQESAKKVVDMLEYITLGDITVATQVCIYYTHTNRYIYRYLFVSILSCLL